MALKDITTQNPEPAPKKTLKLVKKRLINRPGVPGALLASLANISCY
jgi:hypothetical protein